MVYRVSSYLTKDSHLRNPNRTKNNINTRKGKRHRNFDTKNRQYRTIIKLAKLQQKRMQFITCSVSYFLKKMIIIPYYDLGTSMINKNVFFSVIIVVYITLFLACQINSSE